jgi:hypothetical protein
MSAQCEAARELIIMRIKSVDLDCLVKSRHTLPLLLSLSRSTKILKQVLCDEASIVSQLKDGLGHLSSKEHREAFTEEQKEDSEIVLKVIANLSVDNKLFIDQIE